MSKNLKIAVCHANTHPPTAGIGNFAYNIARTLDDYDYEFHLFIRGGKSYNQETEGNLTVHRCPYFRLYPFNNHVHRIFVDRRLRKMRDEIDVLHLHSPISPPLRTELPTITTIHTPLRHKSKMTPRTGLSKYLYKGQNIVSKKIERDLIEKSQKVTTVSESVRQDLQEYRLSKNNIEVTPNGVDTAEFNPSLGNRNGHQLLYTGRLAAEKGLPDLFDAVHQINKTGQSYRLVLTGKGEYRDVLKDKAKRLNIEDRIDFAGFVSRKRLIELYENSDIFVFPTYYEGLPTSILEAMAAGLPIVSTTAHGVTDLLDHEETGLLSPPGESEKLASHIQRLLDDPQLREELGSAARAEAVTEYDWDIVGQKMKSVYEEVAVE